MIVDLRIYTLQPGALGAYLKLYGGEGFPLQSRHLGAPLGYYFTDIGPLNKVVHLWGYADIGERARKRAAMESDPAWTDYRARGAAYLLRQENRILRSAPFFPMANEGRGPWPCVDFRCYDAHPGKLGAFMKLYEGEGMATQMRHLGNCVGWYFSDIGPQNQAVHLWGYASIADRQKRRDAMQADPAWQAYLSKVSGNLAHMENWIVRPAPFWTPAA